MTVCEGNVPLKGGVPSQRAINVDIGVSLKLLNKKSIFQWFKTPQNSYEVIVMDVMAADS